MSGAGEEAADAALLAPPATAPPLPVAKASNELGSSESDSLTAVDAEGAQQSAATADGAAPPSGCSVWLSLPYLQSYVYFSLYIALGLAVGSTGPTLELLARNTNSTMCVLTLVSCGQRLRCRSERVHQSSELPALLCGFHRVSAFFLFNFNVLLMCFVASHQCICHVIIPSISRTPSARSRSLTLCRDEVGMVFTARGIGWIGGSVIAGACNIFELSWIGPHRVMLISAAALGAYLLLLPLVTHLWLLLSIALISSVFCSWIDVGANALIFAVWKDKVGPWMQAYVAVCRFFKCGSECFVSCFCALGVQKLFASQLTSCCCTLSDSLTHGTQSTLLLRHRRLHRPRHHSTGAEVVCAGASAAVRCVLTGVSVAIHRTAATPGALAEGRQAGGRRARR